MKRRMLGTEHVAATTRGELSSRRRSDLRLNEITAKYYLLAGSLCSITYAMRS
jgi:hypothetical protein